MLGSFSLLTPVDSVSFMVGIFAAVSVAGRACSLEEMDSIFGIGGFWKLRVIVSGIGEMYCGAVTPVSEKIRVS